MLGHYQILTVSDHGCKAWIGRSRNIRPSTGKGKQKASPSPSPSSVEEESIPDQSHPVIKKLHLSSPAWVKQAALAKMVSKSKSSSSSKGLAGFTAIVNNANLSAARMETNHGLCLGSSSSRSRSGGVIAKGKAGKTVWLSVSLLH